MTIKERKDVFCDNWRTQAEVAYSLGEGHSSHVNGVEIVPSNYCGDRPGGYDITVNGKRHNFATANAAIHYARILSIKEDERMSFGSYKVENIGGGNVAIIEFSMTTQSWEHVDGMGELLKEVAAVVLDEFL